MGAEGWQSAPVKGGRGRGTAHNDPEGRTDPHMASPASSSHPTQEVRQEVSILLAHLKPQFPRGPEGLLRTALISGIVRGFAPTGRLKLCPSSGALIGLSRAGGVLGLRHRKGKQGERNRITERKGLGAKGALAHSACTEYLLCAWPCRPWMSNVGTEAPAFKEISKLVVAGPPNPKGD